MVKKIKVSININVIKITIKKIIELIKLSIGKRTVPVNIAVLLSTPAITSLLFLDTCT